MSASIELTTPLIGMAAAWFTSTVALIWALSRKSQIWDNSENHEQTLYGNPREGKHGLVQKVETLENVVEEAVSKLKLLSSALDAHGSGEHQIVEGVKRKIREHASALYEEIAKNRRALIAEQTGRFHAVARTPMQVEAIEEDDPFARHSEPRLPPPPQPPPPRKPRSG